MYNVVYEINSNLLGIDLFLYPLLVLPIIGVVIYKFPEILSGKHSLESAKKLGKSWIIGSSTIVLFALLIAISSEKRVVDKYEKGEYRVVEGIVERFKPMSPGHHGNESFWVSNELFKYSTNNIKPGFRKTKVTGGPIREGLNVRISYINGMIVKLEIKNE